MGTKTFDNANDLITFSRASGGTALRKISYGSELVTNGTFDADVSGWFVGTGGSFSWVDGTIEVTGPKNSTAAVGFTTVIGNTYRASGEHINNGTGGWIIKSDSPTGFATNQVNVTPDNATYGVSSVYFVATSTTTYLHLLNLAADTVGKFDNISVKEIIFDQPAGTLTLFNHLNNIPRIEYDAAGAVKGLLIEEARTNLVTYSQDFTDASWTKDSCTINANAIISPDGFTNADEIIPDTTTLTVRKVALSSTAVYTASVWVKDAGRGSCFVSMGSNTVGYLINVDLTNGSYISGRSYGGGVLSGYSITSGGNGWYLVSVTASTPSSVGILVGGGDGVSSASGIYIYGAQVEAGSFPTSYIPTVGATATRAADIASIPTSAFGYNQKEGSVVVEWTQATWGGYVAMLSDGTAANRAMINQFTDGRVYFSTVTNNVAQGDILSGTSVEGVYNKAAATLDLNNAGASLNGAATVVDATYAVPTVTTLSLGSYTVAGSAYINGHIKSIQYYPRRLTNAQLQELTA